MTDTPTHTPQQELNDAVFYALRKGCFFPVPMPKPGSPTQDYVQWGAMRHLHDAIANFARAEGLEP